MNKEKLEKLQKGFSRDMNRKLDSQFLMHVASLFYGGREGKEIGPYYNVMRQKVWGTRGVAGHI